MIKHSIIAPLFLFLALATGCQPAVDIPIPTTTPEATATPTLPPATPTATVTSTEVPISSLPVEELVQKFMAGDVEDISSLSVEQQMRFTQAYAEVLNQKRGANPVVYKNQSYIDPITGKFLDINNGTSKQEQTIQMYLPAYENAEGYLMVQTPDGQWIQIKGSKDVRYDVTNDPFDPNIKWPDAEIVDPQWVPSANRDLIGLTIPQYALAAKTDYPQSMIPIVILDKTLGEMRIGGFGLTGSLRGLIVEKDAGGNPIGARVIILTGNLGLFGTDLTARSSGKLDEITPFWQKLDGNTLYYLLYHTDQTKWFDASYPQLSGEATANYTGFVTSDESHQTIINQINSQDFIWIDGTLLMKADNEK
jgi:hypothetical protein